LRTARISDAEALKIAEEEMKRRFPKFNPSAVMFSVKDVACDLIVEMDRKDKSSRRTGGGSSLVLSRSGEVRLYFGGM